MAFSTLSITRSASADDDSATSLSLEQDDVESISFTRAQIIALTSYAIGGSSSKPEVSSSFTGGIYSVTLYVYTMPGSLSYQLGVTHGKCGSAVRDTVKVSESITFTGQDTTTLAHPADAILSKEWSGTVYDADGAEITPAMSIDGENLNLSEESYGIAVVEYIVTRDIYTVSLSEFEGVYAWAAWSGGVELLKLEVPEGLDDYTADVVEWTSIVNIISGVGADYTPPTVEAEDVTIEVDYCDQTEE